MKKQDDCITIDKVSFEDAGNPIVDDEIPEILRAAIKAGSVVLLTEPDGKTGHKLTLGADGRFQYVACLPV